MADKFDSDRTIVPGKLVSVLVVAVSVALVGGAIAATTMTANADARVQVNDFSIEDASMESADGVGAITMVLNPTVEWANLPEPVESVTVRVFVSGPDGEMVQAMDWTTTGDLPEEQQEWGGTEGRVTFDLSVGVFDETSWSQDDFVPPDGGETSETLDVRIENEVAWNGGSATEEATTTASVTVTDPQEQVDPEVSISGSGYLEIDPPA